MVNLVSIVRRSVFAKIWRILGPTDRRLAVGVFVGLLVAMLFETLSIGAIIPALALFSDSEAAARSPFLGEVLKKLGNPSQAMLVVGGLLTILVLYVIKSLVLLRLAWQQARFLASIRQNMSRRLFETYLMQPWTFHLQRNSSELIRNATTEISMFVQGCQGGLIAAAEACVTTGIAVLLIWMEPVGACVTGITLALATWAMQAVLRRRIIRWGEKRQRSEGLRVQALQQGLGGAKEVKMFGREFEFLEHYRVAEQQASHAIQMQLFAAQIPRLWYELLAVVGVAALGIVLILQGASPATLISRLGLFAVAAFRLMPSLYRLIAGLQTIRFLEPSVNMLSVELALPRIPAEVNPGSRFSFHKGICLQDVSYSYPMASQPALSGVSLNIARGSAVGIIGDSGAGKSTLIDLMLGLLEPASGCIRVDDRDIRTDLRAWQNSIGYVPQSIYLTDDTIRANVAFGVPSASVDDDAVRRSLEAAQLADFVWGLPSGVDTLVGERGVRLSGGQRQRIGIARALYWDPPVLVLDEATSALDSDTEAGVMDAVNDLHGKKTMVIVAHRISTVNRCDSVFRLSHGKLTQSEKAATA
jgi:ABC-type multidrug transport system fused ATPase/permease subunit